MQEKTKDGCDDTRMLWIGYGRDGNVDEEQEEKDDYEE